MSTLTYCAKQATAMAEHATDATRAKLDNAIDAEETRDELIAARAQEIEASRLLAMAPIDVVCGMHSVMEGGVGKLIAERLLADDPWTVGVFVRSLIHSYIKSDSEVIAHDWMDRIDAEVKQWGVQ